MPSVRVLCAGYLVRDGARVVDASSTVTMITSGSRVIIVDTGAPSAIGALQSALKEAGVSATDVGVVINTHLHTDHVAGNDLFSEALVYAHPLEAPPIGTLSATEGTQICEGVTIMETPGHTAGSISVLVRSDRDYVVCGDAVPTITNYESMVPPAIHIDRRLAMSSMERVLRMADSVVPGHGAEFEVMGKK